MNRLIFLVLLALSQPIQAADAYFAGGCFWCMEAAYQDVDGVDDVISGFTGGSLPNPTYKSDHSGHYEAVKVSYDPDKISYQELLDLYWVNIDPFDPRGQFCDKGLSYRAALFYSNAEEQALQEASLQRVIKRFPEQNVVTEVLPVTEFWPVEEYHQDYYLKNPLRYRYYRYGCGRDQRLEQIWGEDARH